MQPVFRMNEQGLIAEYSYKDYLTCYNSLLNTPGGAAIWKEVSPGHAPYLIGALEQLSNDLEKPTRLGK